MTAQERRAAIREALSRASGPLSASALAGRFGVSRQLVVGDIALLRAGGADITATARGYVVQGQGTGFVRRLACRHDAGAMERELLIMVDQGCTVLDVIVDHPEADIALNPLYAGMEELCGWEEGYMADVEGELLEAGFLLETDA